jgi:hypothetical protein
VRTLRSNVTQFTMTFAGLLPFAYPQPAHDVEATEAARLERLSADEIEQDSTATVEALAGDES